MGQLIGLKGVKAKNVECQFISRASQIRKILANGKAATSANTNGAINIWIDDEKCFRCDAMRYCISIDERKFRTFPPVVKWTQEWLKKIK